MKLHLGCGQKYLKGYLNIDFPISHHSLLAKSVADRHIDITKLKYKANAIEEIRLHHVFEHFPRSIACALVVTWRSWLKPGGILHIEVPDFDKSAQVILNPLTPNKAKFVALRHIFGSHEADWANHYEGWSIKRLTNFLKDYQFDIIKTNKSHWLGTHNISIIAKKNNQKLSKKKSEIITKSYLQKYLVDKSSSELNLLRVWIRKYHTQINNQYYLKKNLD